MGHLAGSCIFIQYFLMGCGGVQGWCLIKCVASTCECNYDSPRSINAKVSGDQRGAVARVTMAKPCRSRRGVLNVRVSRRRTT